MQFPLNVYHLYAIIKHPKLVAGEMAQWVKALTAKPDDLRSMLRTHVVEGHRLYFYLHTCMHHGS